MAQKQYCLALYHSLDALTKAQEALKAAGVARESYSLIRLAKMSVLSQSGKKRGDILHLPERDSVLCDGSFFQDIALQNGSFQNKEILHDDGAQRVDDSMDLSLFFEAIGMPKDIYKSYQDALAQGDTLLLTYGSEQAIRQHCKTLDGFGTEKPVLYLS